MSAFGYIYRHWIIENNNENSYIGQTREKKPQTRWGKDGNGYKPEDDKEGTIFWKAIQEYGWNNFNHDILLKIECQTIEELIFWLDEWEKYYIWYYDSYYKNGNGYNMTLGGQNGFYTKKERKVYCVEMNKTFQSAIYAQYETGIPNGNIYYACNSDTHLTGGYHWWYDDEYDKDYIYIPKGRGEKKVICVTNNMVYNSMTEAAKITGCDLSSVHSCCHHIITQTNGLQFLFYEDFLNGVKTREKRTYVRSVVRLTDGKIYSDMNEACEDNKVHKGNIVKAIQNKTTTNGHYWCYLEDWDGTIKERRQRYKKVKCLETGIIYNSPAEAQRETGFNKESIAKNCKGIKDYVKNAKTKEITHWMYIE